MKVTLDDIDDIVYTVSKNCVFCSQPFEEYIDPFDGDSIQHVVVATLNNEGWEIIEGEGEIGLACPDCVAEHNKHEGG